jgi:hypothetical protein
MSLKVIGAGYGRTATLSLKLALEQIGFGPCYHMTEVFLKPESAGLWIQAANGTPDWEAIFKDFAATVDFPGCTFWRQLSEYYPQAKVLLSVRDPQKWFESTQETIFSERGIDMVLKTPMKPFLEKVVWNLFGDRIHDRDFLVDTFKKHNAEVQRSIPKERLLVYEASQGWEPLCKFLGVPVPAAPFPRVNSREEMNDMMAAHTDGFDLQKVQQDLKARLGKA